jgi:hypothetical protein
MLCPAMNACAPEDVVTKQIKTTAKRLFMISILVGLGVRFPSPAAFGAAAMRLLSAC